MIDIETSGLNPKTDAILQISAVLLDFVDEAGGLQISATYDYEVLPFEGAHIDPKSLQINRIDPFAAGRNALAEAWVLKDLFQKINAHRRAQKCVRAILVGHNASFDRDFLNNACVRCGIKSGPLHPFSCFDTVPLAALAYGQTVLAKACEAAGLGFDVEQAHSAHYDASQTAQLFCHIVNLWEALRSGDAGVGG